MTTEANTTALTAEQAEAQVCAWIAAGLPDGKVFRAETRNVIHVKTAEPSDIAVWAVALGVEEIQVSYAVVAIGIAAPICPVLLPGWALEVWCDQPVVPAEMRIEVAR